MSSKTVLGWFVSPGDFVAYIRKGKMRMGVVKKVTPNDRATIDYIATMPGHYVWGMDFGVECSKCVHVEAKINVANDDLPADLVWQIMSEIRDKRRRYRA